MGVMTLHFINLDVVRTLGNLSVVAFHSFLYWGRISNLEKGLDLVKENTVLKILSLGNFGVDALFIMSGLLASYTLVPLLERAATGGAKATKTILVRYYRSRWTRILIPYVVALVMIRFGIPHGQKVAPALKENHDVVFQYCPDTFPLNLVLLNNFIGFGGCGVYLWSVAVQMHFFFLFPLVLVALNPGSASFRKRGMIMCCTGFVVSSLFRLVLSVLLQVQWPVPPYDHDRMTESDKNLAFMYYHSLYFPTPSRLPNFMAGALLGFLILSLPASQVSHQKVKYITHGLSASAAALFFYILLWKFRDREATGSWRFSSVVAALCFHGSPLSSMAIGSVTLAFILETNVPRGRKKWRYFSEASYDVYLFHMIALYWIEEYLLPSGYLTHLSSLHWSVSIATIFLASYCGGLAFHMAFNGLKRAASSVWVHSKLEKSQARPQLS